MFGQRLDIVVKPGQLDQRASAAPTPIYNFYLTHDSKKVIKYCKRVLVEIIF